MEELKRFFMHYGTVILFCIALGVWGLATITSVANKGISTIISVKQTVYEQEKEHEEELFSSIEEGYTVYLDGIEVDAENIDVMLYASSIDHEKKVIYLTKR